MESALEVIVISDDEDEEESDEDEEDGASIESVDIVSVRERNPKDLFFGYDPGTTNPGFAWLDVIGRCVYMYSIDFHKARGDGLRYVVSPSQLGAFILLVFKDPKVNFLMGRTKYAGFEKMEFGTCNQEVVRARSELVQTIRIFYPHVHMFDTIPQNLRTFFDINGYGVEYIDRKELSMTTGMLSDADHKAYIRKCRRYGKLLFDPMEASLIALYVYKTLDDLLAKEPVPIGKPCNQPTVEFISRVNLGPPGKPPPKPAHKRSILLDGSESTRTKKRKKATRSKLPTLSLNKKQKISRKKTTKTKTKRTKTKTKRATKPKTKKTKKGKA